MKNSILSFMVIVLLFTIQLRADVYMKYKEKNSGMAMMGQQQSAEEEIEKIWIAKNKIRVDVKDESRYILLKENKMLIFNHSEKTFSEWPLDGENVMEKSMQGKSDEEKQEMQGFMQMAQGMMKFEMTIFPTSESKKINKWNCKKYKQEVKMGMGPINSDIWATEELNMDYELYARFNTAMMSTSPGFSDSFDKALQEFEKIKGIPVLIETTMNMMGMQMKSTRTLLEYKNESAPKGTFDIPKGYKKVDMMQDH